MIFIRCVSKGVWLVRVRNDEDRATLWHWHGGVYLITSAAETTFNSKRESKNRYGHGRTYGYGPEIYNTYIFTGTDQQSKKKIVRSDLVIWNPDCASISITVDNIEKVYSFRRQDNIVMKTGINISQEVILYIVIHV